MIAGAQPFRSGRSVPLGQISRNASNARTTRIAPKARNAFHVLNARNARIHP